jgi:SagB-type dehydrogenase family enzyme
MPGNRDTAVAWKYHNATKHSYASIRTNPHALDWANKPLLFKIYPTLEVTRLPREARQTGVSAISALGSDAIDRRPSMRLNLEAVAQLLFLSAGITKSKKYDGQEIFFRAAACTGALYEIELYLVCGDLPELAAGVYHFGVAEFGLRQLRAGDYRRVLAESTASSKQILEAPLTIVCTGTYWRNAWKYQARTYRHFGWDNGTILANMIAVSVALGLPAWVVTGFVDDTVNRLIDLDTQKEVAFSMVALGRGSFTSDPPGSLKSLGLPLLPLSKVEVDYPLMREMHAASSLATNGEVADYLKDSGPAPHSPADTKLIPLPGIAEPDLPKDVLEEVILRRGSTRRFAQVPITSAQLSCILDLATRPLPCDFVQSPRKPLNDLYVIVNAVEGLASGSYFYVREEHALELLRQGNFRKAAGYLGLEQQLPSDASVNIFFLADLQRIVTQYGNRGYRATQLEAGILGGKVYLAAYAQRLGASGLTFYDDDVVQFFSPHAQGKNAIFLVALGKSA